MTRLGNTTKSSFRMPFRRHVSERLLNAFMNGRSGLNDSERQKAKYLNIKGKHLNAYRSGVPSDTFPFTTPRLLETGVRCETERQRERLSQTGGNP